MPIYGHTISNSVDMILGILTNSNKTIVFDFYPQWNAGCACVECLVSTVMYVCAHLGIWCLPLYSFAFFSMMGVKWRNWTCVYYVDCHRNMFATGAGCFMMSVVSEYYGSSAWQRTACRRSQHCPNRNCFSTGTKGAAMRHTGFQSFEKKDWYVYAGRMWVWENRRYRQFTRTRVLRMHSRVFGTLDKNETEEGRSSVLRCWVQEVRQDDIVAWAGNRECVH